MTPRPPWRRAAGRARRDTRALVTALLGAAIGCAPAPPHAPERRRPPRPAQARPSAPRALPPLSGDELRLSAELRAEVTALAALGERSARRKWELAEAADLLALSLDSSGYAVERQGFDYGDTALLNLSVVIPPRSGGSRWLVVGAHYDSAEGSPGANDGASGAAALLALARRLRPATPAIGLRLVWFSGSRPPLAGTDAMGSLVQARSLQTAGIRVVGMVALESLGYFERGAGAPRPLHDPALALPGAGGFVAVLGDPASAPLVDTLADGLVGHATLPVSRVASDAAASWLERTDAWAFRQVGVPAAAISDGGASRDPHHGRAGDTAGRLDFDRMARVVAGLQAALVALTETGPGG